MDGLHANISFDESSNYNYALPSYQLANKPLISNTYTACFIAGGLSSSIRWALIPLEVVKTRMQVDGSSSIMIGLSNIYRTEGLRGLHRGLAPTAMAYGIQTSSKYGFYEVFHDRFVSSGTFNPYLASALAAGLAEATADVLMCPFEMIKAKMQTSVNFPQRLVPAMVEMVRLNKHNNNNFPFGSLKAIWMRQIPGTMVNFLLFESTAQRIYNDYLRKPSSECSFAEQMAVTFAAGTTAGIVSAVVSHPADSIISLMANHHHHSSTNYISTLPKQSSSIVSVVRQVGLYTLATRGLLPRVIITTHIICGQWVLYKTFKSLLLEG